MEVGAVSACGSYQQRPENVLGHDEKQNGELGGLLSGEAVESACVQLDVSLVEHIDHNLDLDLDLQLLCARNHKSPNLVGRLVVTQSISIWCCPLLQRCTTVSTSKSHGLEVGCILPNPIEFAGARHSTY